jgi:tetratricopeptide (TPR) repeat protein
VRDVASRTVVLLMAWGSTLGLVASCAPRASRPTSAQLSDLARSDALVREGCYRCLQQAREVYATLAIVSPRRVPSLAMLRKEFDTTLLLIARAKELGLPFEAELTRARELLKKQQNQPASSAEELSARIDAIEAIVGDLTALDSEERYQRDQRLQTEAAALADRSSRLRQILRQTAATDLTSAYLAQALDCERSGRRPATERLDVPTPDPDAPLWRYRLALCGANPQGFQELRARDARWLESFYFEGKIAMGSPARAAEPARAAALLTSAAEALPDSIPAHMLLGNAHEMDGGAAAALAAFDRVLAIKPLHLDAQLGRVRNLSYLGRTDEGIAAATVLIERGSWHVGDAYYWRAWNGYQAQRLDGAWADVQQALSLLSNTAVHALAGSIAYARKELDVAVRHFTRAFEIDPSNCLAIASAGLVHGDQRAWPSAADDHVNATRCFAQAAATARADLAKLTDAPLEPPVKASRIASTEKRRDSAEELGARAALSAAQSFIEMGDGRQALTYIELAARHPATGAKAATLKARIGGAP